MAKTRSFSYSLCIFNFALQGFSYASCVGAPGASCDLAANPNSLDTFALTQSRISILKAGLSTSDSGRGAKFSSNAGHDEDVHAPRATNGNEKIGHDENNSASAQELRSKIECKDTPGYNQTCLIRNAYLMPGSSDQVTLLVLEGDQLPTVLLQSWGGPQEPTRLDVRRFASLELLRDGASRLRPLRKPGLSLLFTALWTQNWAHAIFDGLYPAFVALAKFGRHGDAFLPVVVRSNETQGLDCRNPSVQAQSMQCAMDEAFRLFGSFGGDKVLSDDGEIIKRDLFRSEIWSPDCLLLDELVVGSGGQGEYVSVSALPATQSTGYLPARDDVLLAFRERLYGAHGVLPPSRRSRSDEGRDPAAALKVLVTDNKRSTPELSQTLQLTAAYLNGQAAGQAAGQANPSRAALATIADTATVASSKRGMVRPRGNLNVTFVKWEELQPWGGQLKLLRDTDILVSGIGCALFYSLLLPDGAAVLNLGYSGHLAASKGWDELYAASAGRFPSYGEEVLGMSNHRARTFYLPLDQVHRGPSALELSSLLAQAETTIRAGFDIPLASPEENLGIFGKIILDLARGSEASFRGLSGMHASPVDYVAMVSEQFTCHARSTGQTSAAALVYEQNSVSDTWSHSNHSLIDSCHIDVQLLRKLKVKYKLQEALGLSSECECIVCEACAEK